MFGEARAGHPQADPAKGRRSFLITVDTEGDNLWSKPREITVKNAEVLPRFQQLCEMYDLKPTYLVNWEMVNSPFFVEFGVDALKRSAAEIGMHLHAWNSPPVVPLTNDDYTYQPYLMEYPEDLLREKVRVMTDTLESTFGVKMRSHRAGRWGLNEIYARALIDAGYRVDCSVTPHVNWKASSGDPAGSGGPDYRSFPETPYFVDPTAVARPGTSSLLEVPMTVLPIYESAGARGLRATIGRIPYVRRPVHRAYPGFSWLHPVGNTSERLTRILSVAKEKGRDYVEFMVHSSELMAGGSPWFDSEADIEMLFEDLEVLFAASVADWRGRTLGEYHDALTLSLPTGTTPVSD